MLLEFKATNYKSFQELYLSMLPAPKQKGLDYSVMTEKIGGKKYKALCSSVIYGPNAAGKTNIIGALDVFKRIVLRGHIRNDGEYKTPNAAAKSLELIPNSFVQSLSPVTFGVSFIIKDLLVEYEFSADFGKFLQKDYPRRIISEQLSLNKTTIFSRSNDVKFSENSLDQFPDYFSSEVLDNLKAAEFFARNTDSKELYLTKGFKENLSPKLAALISEWFQTRLIVIYSSNHVLSVPTLDGEMESENEKVAEDKSIFIQPQFLNEVVSQLGSDSTLGYAYDTNNKKIRLASLLSQKTGDLPTAINANSYESYGTIRFANLYPFLEQAFINGGTLVMDEFDASLHPMAVMSIINIFHNDEINKNHAQLIFNTHNPIFLDSNLFRRDEIKFVERDDETHISELYSLSDFGTDGKSGVRKSDDYMKHYFMDRYGAIRDVDFAPIFEKILEQENKSDSPTEEEEG